jgi:hypothetical protein
LLFNNDAPELRINGVARQPFTIVPDLGMTRAFYDGLHLASLGSRANEPTVLFDCHPGNCTWPLFTTAAICSKCIDVSSLIVTRHYQSSRYEGCTDQDVYSPQDGTYMKADCTTYELPYGHIRRDNGTIVRGPTSFRTLDIYGQELRLTASSTSNFSKTVGLQMYHTLFYSFLIFRANDSYANSKGKWESSPPTATECGLYFCANAYRASCSNNVLIEELMGSWAVRTPWSWSVADIAHNQHDDDAYSAFDKDHPDLGIGIDMPPERSDLIIEIPVDDMKLYPGANSTFNISQSTILGLQAMLNRIVYDSDSDREYSNSKEDVMVFPPNKYTNDSKLRYMAIVDTFWKSANLTESFQIIAHQMTIELRNTVNFSIVGAQQRYVLYIRIGWAFLFLPLATLVVGCIYVIAIIIQTRKLRLPEWSESTYPTLAYGFDVETQALLKAADRNVQKSAARRFRNEIPIQLLVTEEGYKLQAGTA